MRARAHSFARSWSTKALDLGGHLVKVETQAK